MLQRPNPSAAPMGATSLSKPFPGTSCRGEDSNLCSVAEHDLTVGTPLLSGSGLSPLYGLTLCLVLAAALGWPFLLVFVLIAGPALGAHHVLSPDKEKVASE